MFHYDIIKSISKLKSYFSLWNVRHSTNAYEVWDDAFWGLHCLRNVFHMYHTCEADLRHHSLKTDLVNLFAVNVKSSEK